MTKILKPLGWVAGFQAVSAFIGVVTKSNMGWYDELEKAALNPPDIIFPIVWTALYVLLALAAWRMWEGRKAPEARIPFLLFWAQMFMNWGWSFVFFQFHAVLAGFVWIVMLDILMLLFVLSAWQGHKMAAALVLPTLLWGCFAAYLNYSVWILN
jgi:tryptophan-rich sensory protein